MRRRKRTILALGALGAFALALPLFAQSPPSTTNPCEICVPRTVDQNSTPTQKVSAWACQVARIITCDDQSDACWIAHITDLVLRTSDAAVAIIPSHLVCQNGQCPNAPSLLFGVFMIAMAITLMVSAARSWTQPDSLLQWPMTLLRSIIAIGIAYVLGFGFAYDLWNLSGRIVSIGALTGQALNFTSAQTTLCNVPQIQASAGGWPTVTAILDSMVRNIIDLAGVLIGIGISILPGPGAAVQVPTEMLINAVTLNFDMEIFLGLLRFLFAFTLMGAAVSFIIIFLFALYEAIILLALTLALSPLIAWLWNWRALRSSAYAALNAVLYASIVFATANITLQISYVIIELSLAQFAIQIKNPNYTPLALDPYAPYVTCLLPRSPSLYHSYEYYLCLNDLPQQSGEYATLIDNNISQWLPAILLIIATAIIASAVLRYASAAASELTGHKQAHSTAAKLSSQIRSKIGQMFQSKR